MSTHLQQVRALDRLFTRARHAPVPEAWYVLPDTLILAMRPGIWAVHVRGTPVACRMTARGALETALKRAPN